MEHTKSIEDETYKGKNMGVIVLQGNAQAELIERKLAELLEPKEREERKTTMWCTGHFPERSERCNFTLVGGGSQSFVQSFDRSPGPATL